MGLLFIISLAMLIIGIVKKNKKIIIASSIVLIGSVLLIINFFIGLDRMRM